MLARGWSNPTKNWIEVARPMRVFEACMTWSRKAVRMKLGR